jgi:hypothetical protein
MYSQSLMVPMMRCASRSDLNTPPLNSTAVGCRNVASALLAGVAFQFAVAPTWRRGTPPDGA